MMLTVMPLWSAILTLWSIFAPIISWLIHRAIRRYEQYIYDPNNSCRMWCKVCGVRYEVMEEGFVNLGGGVSLRTYWEAQDEVIECSCNKIKP